MRVHRLWVVVGLVGSFAGATTARAQEAVTACEPACAAGQTCIDGVCMVPAAPAATAPPATATPPAAGYPSAPPPAYVYPPPPPPAPRPPRTGLLVLPYVGINSINGEGEDPDTGLRAGSIIGAQINDRFSANGELGIDQVNFDAPAGTSVWEYIFNLTFSPLFHFATPSAEFVLGPKVGAWAMFGHASGYGQAVDVRARGWTLGLNAGVFFPVNAGTSLGLLLSYATLRATQVCFDTSYYSEQCEDGDDEDVRLLGLNAAALF